MIFISDFLGYAQVTQAVLAIDASVATKSNGEGMVACAEFTEGESFFLC